MVSTRQMSNVGGQSGSGSEDGSSGESTPSRSTKSNSIALYSQGHSGKSQTKVAFLDLPQEIIEKIFGYLTFKNVCQLRFVSARIDRICGHILNTTFQRLQNQLLDRFHEIKKKMPRRESARRNHHLACESDIIETLHMRLTLLQMSLGKHIERKHCCFFPGEILDEVFHILHYIRVTPKLARPYKVTDELFDLSTMAMEYFKEKIEPDLPEIAYFNTDFLEFPCTFPSTSTKNYLCLDSFSPEMEEPKDADIVTPSTSEETSPVQDPAPQSNIVLRKGIRKIKQGLKRYNSQLTILRQDVRSCRQKAAEQQKLMSEQQKQLAEHQKQIVEYATRMDENEKKNDEVSRKFSTLLQELNKCKTELQYWRSKSPATPLLCNGCGNAVLPHPEELEALANQGVNPEFLEPIDFVPIEGVVEEPLDEASTAGTSTRKRKIEEIKETLPKPGGSSKKTRRIIKGRNKRAKF